MKESDQPLENFRFY